MKRLTYHHVKSATKNFNLVLLVAIIITGVIITWLGIFNTTSNFQSKNN